MVTATTRTMTGARAILNVGGTPMGTFSTFSYSYALDVEHIYTLGAFSAQEIVYTAQGPVACQATGWRAIEQGPHVQGKVPKLQDLLNHQYITLTVLDRQTNKIIGKVENVRPTGYSTQVSARQAEEVSVSFTGTIVSDESGDHFEAASASKLPPPPVVE